MDIDQQLVERAAHAASLETADAGRSKMQAIRNSYATDMRGSACAHDRSEGSSGCGGSSGRGAGLLLGGRRDGIGPGIGLGRGAGTRSGGNGSHGAAQPRVSESCAAMHQKRVSIIVCHPDRQVTRPLASRDSNFEPELPAPGCMPVAPCGGAAAD